MRERRTIMVRLALRCVSRRVAVVVVCKK